MASQWTSLEEQFLIYWMNQGRMYQWDSMLLLDWIGKQLQRSRTDCMKHWERLCASFNQEERTVLISQAKPNDSTLRHRMQRLEEQLEKIMKENEKLKRDMRFFESVLLEEYQLLLHLVNKDQGKLRIHRAD
ncbi:hypothetical protein [Thermoflavimicrobium dichotomicum]|uniref:Myb-like domain-containing protein n=1 Tax=Thermoflavimicrobium dichotomicum TaxID=46223 RepID=A0A1I3MIQ3_9BACL|nr:hypothetical protein [Thermoflavimicrobium dichotomicum]SFI96898.1 hypothetical protein SAMN05421852_10386 [Thermoflavimicrobium dichotomicum]